QLQAMGHTVTMAMDGEEAWDLYRTGRPQIVITDWMMPKIDGLEFTRMVRAHRDEFYAYVIFLTVLHGKGSFLEAMEAGADDYITKPFDLQQLKARLRVAERILGMQRELHQLEQLLPICSYCRRIKVDEDQWTTIESYIMMKTDTVFSHGVCPDCYEQHAKPAIDRMNEERKGKHSGRPPEDQRKK
ncbi:MAG TPA: response regulator, partial [Bacteroidota bacterium]|nr:response regulator [Bacteroidota bacterium]